jgi:hypothetical protein
LSRSSSDEIFWPGVGGTCNSLGAREADVFRGTYATYRTAVGV